MDMNLLDAYVDRVLVTGLIRTGAHISVMSDKLRGRLTKLLAPGASCVVRVADVRTSATIGT